MVIKELKLKGSVGSTKYYITSLGTVLSSYIPKDSPSIKIHGYEYALRNLNQGSDGYWTVTIRHKKYAVHRLVAEYFLEPPSNPDRKYVNHRNGHKEDNYVNNLEWVTASENTQHAIRLGLRKTNSQDFITRTVCSKCEKPMYYLRCKIVEDDEKKVIYKKHGASKIIKITRRKDYKKTD